MINTKIICLTPVKNGEWMIEKFIKCASLWADHIIISDQNSSDQTVKICEGFDNVKIIKNEVDIFDEVEMRQKLLDEARKTQCDKRIIIYLDSDELLSANFINSNEWETLKCQKEGTFFTAKLINYYPLHDTYFSPPANFLFAFIDRNDLNFSGNKIHGWRVPLETNSKIINLFELKILHLPYLNYDRVVAKNLWYKCVEKIKNDKIGSLHLNRKYDIKDLNSRVLFKSNPIWLQNYINEKIDVFSEITYSRTEWYLQEILRFFQVYGVEKFQYLDIWEQDWHAIAKKKNVNLASRSLLSKIVRKYSRFSIKRSSWIVLSIEKFLDKFF